jgi:hypothetical protein
MHIFLCIQGLICNINGEGDIKRDLKMRGGKKGGVNIMYGKFLFGHRPARQCLSEQNALDNLDSKKVILQKILVIMAVAGG